MVLLLEKLFHNSKFPSKLKNHHHHHHNQYEVWEGSLKTFCSCISISKFHPVSPVSLSWVHNCFSYLLHLNKMLARLVVEIDYPMSKWESLLIKEYLNYSLRLLDSLNLVKSCISYLGQARLSMALSLSLIESSASFAIEQLRSSEFKNFEIKLKIEEDVKEMKFFGKELIFHQALMEMKQNVDLVFGIILSSLSGDIKPYVELKKSGNWKAFDGFIDENIALKELKDVNEAKACLVSAFKTGKASGSAYEDVNKLEMKLAEIQKHLDRIGNEADELFSKILAGRKEVLDILRHQNH